MKPTRAALWTALAATLLMAAPPGAWAETGDSRAEAARLAAEGEPGAGDAMARWEAERSWRYGTDYLLPLTRGLREAGVPRWARPAAWLVTLPLDAAQLPFGLAAGFFGD